MNGASVKKSFLMFFSGNDPICHCQNFQPSQTPHSHFLPISPRFLTNIRCRYFSLNIWVVYDHLELDWRIFDQIWAKTRPLHFQIFQILIAIDRRIVQWTKDSWDEPFWTSLGRRRGPVDLCGGPSVVLAILGIILKISDFFGKFWKF